MTKVKLKRHESFPLREGWIEKGLKSIKENGISTFNKTNGIIFLGIGSNMVNSLKYWMSATNIINTKEEDLLTEFGKVLIEKDPYLEQDASLWFLHYFLVSNFNESPVLYYAHNKYEGKHIDKISLYEDVSNYFNHLKYEYNEKLLAEDVGMYFRLYYNDNPFLNPESNLTSPLSKLNLLDRSSDDKDFIKKEPDMKMLNPLVVYYVLQELYDNNFSINDAYSRECSPCKIFNLDKGLFNQYIVILKNMNLITINKTAGLNAVYLNNKLSISTIYEMIKEKKYVI